MFDKIMTKVPKTKNMKMVNEKKVNKICNEIKEIEERVRNPETLTSEKRIHSLN